MDWRRNCLWCELPNHLREGSSGQNTGRTQHQRSLHAELLPLAETDPPPAPDNGIFLGYLGT